MVYDSLGQYSKALDFDQQALAVSREVGDRLNATWYQTLVLERLSPVHTINVNRFWKQGRKDFPPGFIWGLEIKKKRGGSFVASCGLYPNGSKG